MVIILTLLHKFKKQFKFHRPKIKWNGVRVIILHHLQSLQRLYILLFWFSSSKTQLSFFLFFFFFYIYSVCNTKVEYSILMDI